LAFDKRKRQVLKRFGLSPPLGVMLYGPPGTGKTLLAKATALMMQPNPSKDSVATSVRGGGGFFISLSASDIIRSEVGRSEKLVSSAFKTARENSPAVIFIDEFQALFTSRDGTSGGGGKGSGRLASTLLQCMDDIDKWREADSAVLVEGRNAESDSNRVVVLGATNTPWMIDRAFLRAGRFDRVSNGSVAVWFCKAGFLIILYLTLTT
jgi:SpoVK/Ycf46/Vps4 family AAA+-type ATPase